MHAVKRFFPALICAVVFAGAGCFWQQKKVAPPAPVQGDILKSLNLNIQSEQNNKLTLRRGVDSVSLFKESRGMIFNGVAVSLPDPVTVSPENRWEISDKSAKMFLEPLLEKRKFPIRTIVIDPGHGGHDSGAVSVHGAAEKNLNLLLALNVAAELRKKGFKVVMTREKDKFISLDKRPEIAEKCKADLFISIHHNSAPNINAAGFEIFLHTPQSEKDIDRAAKGANLALQICRRVSPLNTFPGRGVKHANFKVLRLAKCPAILIEAGFLSHPAESAYMATNHFRKNFSTALAEEIAGFVSVDAQDKLLQAAR
ncbi:MAG: N-acetylmuramoyl-L-alanine amidase [Lentisphaeria bacterium]|nr:N-acetylmuramoyl-L-alanine amidase [Lentisphaeria bacterium]